MSRSRIFLRSVLRLRPSSAAASVVGETGKDPDGPWPCPPGLSDPEGERRAPCADRRRSGRRSRESYPLVRTTWISRSRIFLRSVLRLTPSRSAALAASRGNQIRAADLLGLNRNTLRKKIRDLDIQVIRTSG